MKKWYPFITILIVLLLFTGCGQPKLPVPPAAISEIFALEGTEAVGKYAELKEVQDREDLFYIMVYIKSLPGEFTTLEDALPQAQEFTRTVIESAVEILNRHNINKDVSVWAQLPIKEGGVTILGHADYDAKHKSFRDFELYKP